MENVLCFFRSKRTFFDIVTLSRLVYCTILILEFLCFWQIIRFSPRSVLSEGKRYEMNGCFNNFEETIKKDVISDKSRRMTMINPFLLVTLNGFNESTQNFENFRGYHRHLKCFIVSQQCQLRLIQFCTNCKSIY